MNWRDRKKKVVRTAQDKEKDINKYVAPKHIKQKVITYTDDAWCGMNNNNTTYVQFLMAALKASWGCRAPEGDSWDALSLAGNEQTRVSRCHPEDYVSPRSLFEPKGSNDTFHSHNAADTI